MKKIQFLLLLLVPFAMSSNLHPVAYPFPENESVYIKDEPVMKAGTKLYLFHSGTEDVKNSINVNDSLTVYRMHPADSSMETRVVGKVRVLSPLGDYYFDGEVIGGEVKAGDLAIKGTVACFIMSLKKIEHHSRLHVK
jgi:hypothetical protein